MSLWPSGFSLYGYAIILVIFAALSVSELPSAVWAVPHLMKQALHAIMEIEHISICLYHLLEAGAQPHVLGSASQMVLHIHTRWIWGTLSVEALEVLARRVNNSAARGSNSGSDGDDVQCLMSGVSGQGKPLCGMI